MKRISLSLAIALLKSPLFANGEKTEPRALGDKVKISGEEVSWDGPNGQWRDSFKCVAPRELSVSFDKKWAACCEEGAALKGSATTEFHCCGGGHDVAGSKETGYTCCLEGYTYDGSICKPVCSNGKVLVDGKCVCPEGYVGTADGGCKKKDDSKGCSSGLETGKCYQFKGETGRKLTYKGGQYSESVSSAGAIPGKFQFCRDKKCEAGLPVNPGQEIHIRDMNGSPPNGDDAGFWLNNNVGGTHIGKTGDYSKSGNFTITKWPCGKYCLSGMERGLGPACPATDPSLTFYSKISEACVEFELIEVPCKIRDDANNCIWKSNKNQCCGGTVDCSAPTGPSPTEPKPDETDKTPSVPKPTLTPDNICPKHHGDAITVGGIGFRILCGFNFESKDGIEEIKDVLDPLTCHAKCLANKKCQGANWDFTKSVCGHSVQWNATIEASASTCLTFRASFQRPI